MECANGRGGGCSTADAAHLYSTGQVFCPWTSGWVCERLGNWRSYDEIVMGADTENFSLSKFVCNIFTTLEPHLKKEKSKLIRTQLRILNHRLDFSLINTFAAAL